MSKRTGKKAKDPNAPKKGRSAYFIFLADYRKKMKDEKPDLSFGEIAKLLGEKWSNLNEEEKNLYIERSAEEKRIYEEEYQKYIQTNGPFVPEESVETDEKPKKRKKRAEKDPNAPKRPLSGYMLFSQKIRESVQKENPGAKVTEAAQITGKLWRGLSQEEKAPFEANAKLLKEAYEKAKAKYDEELEKVKRAKVEE